MKWAKVAFGKKSYISFFYVKIIIYRNKKFQIWHVIPWKFKRRESLIGRTTWCCYLCTIFGHDIQEIPIDWCTERWDWLPVCPCTPLGLMQGLFDQVTTLRASDPHNARATFLNPFNKMHTCIRYSLIKFVRFSFIFFCWNVYQTVQICLKRCMFNHKSILDTLLI